MTSPSTSARACASLRSERGETLVELLVGAIVALIVLGAVVGLLITAQRQTTRDVNYALAQSSAQQQLDTMVSEIRQAWNILSSSPNSVLMDVTLNGTPYQILYECDIPSATAGYQQCVRLQTAVGATLPPLSSATTVIPEISDGTATSPVFSWGPSPIAPYYMTATIDVPSTDGAAAAVSLNHTIVFSDGALMRNENVQN